MQEHYNKNDMCQNCSNCDWYVFWDKLNKETCFRTDKKLPVIKICEWYTKTIKGNENE